MITLKISFDYDGQKHNYTAVLKDNMELSTSRANQAVDLIDDTGDGDRWSLIFGDTESEHYEAVMLIDADGEMTTELDYIIVWDGAHDCIAAEIDGKCKVSRK